MQDHTMILTEYRDYKAVIAIQIFGTIGKTNGNSASFCNPKIDKET